MLYLVHYVECDMSYDKSISIEENCLVRVLKNLKKADIVSKMVPKKCMEKLYSLVCEQQ